LLPAPASRKEVMSFINSRLRRVEAAARKGPAGRCRECGLPPNGPGYIVLIDEEDPDKSVAGDPNERCEGCDRPLWFVIEVMGEGA
jgi:hypothetical protein